MDPTTKRELLDQLIRLLWRLSDDVLQRLDLEGHELATAELYDEALTAWQELTGSAHELA